MKQSRAQRFDDLAVARRIRGSQHNHWNSLIFLGFADTPQHVTAIALRQIQVKYDQIGDGCVLKPPSARDIIQRLLSIRHHDKLDLPPLEAQCLAEEIHVGWIIFRKQNRVHLASSP